jgi:glycosyltransferase involved in cell wall biosynthesis
MSKVYVVVRSLGVYSEAWLLRQLTSHTLFAGVFSAAEVTQQTNLPKVWQLPQATSIASKIKKIFRLPNNLQHQRNTFIRQHTKQNDVLIFHYIDFALNFKKLIEIKRHRVLVYCHGYDITWNKTQTNNPNEPYFSKDYINKVVQLSQYVTFIANSKSTQNKLLTIGIPANKIQVNYFGIETIALPTVEQKNQVFTFLFLGRLVDFKGPDWVLNAFELACSKGMNAQLIIAGDGPLRLHIELLAKRSVYKNKIQVLGAVDQQTAKMLMTQSHVFTAHNCMGELTNQEEAFGVAYLEAMANGLPVIACNSGGVPEQIVNKQTGILINPFDVEVYANAMLSLHNNLALFQQMSDTAKQHVQENFSLQIEEKSLKAIIKEA